MRVPEAIEQFLCDLKTEGRSPHTIAAYRRDLTVFTTFASNITIEGVTPGLLTSFMATQSVQVGRSGIPRAKATINRYRVSLKALFAWCETRWLIKRNPTGILKCRRHRSLPPEVLTEKEITHLLGFPFAGRWAERDRALLTFMLGTGCRLGETVALNARDIDWDTGTVTLHCAKGGEPEVVTVSKTVLAILRPLVEGICLSSGTDLASGTDLGHPLFCGGTDRRLSARQVQRIVTGRCIEAGITKPITPHSLRHTFATVIYNQTGDIRLVQHLLRHRHITTTETYAQVAPQRIQNATEYCIQFTSD